ncbi:DnaJ-domain-containing protein [Dentipellis sp. KUC8613]|nr:DnaJ-domain-containing protein [Dentipellis sp. KUC8613]
MDPSNVNFYRVLGVSRTATAEDIRKAYKQKVLETHPDKLPPEVSDRAKQRAKDKFGLVHEAFQVLGDPDTRRAYDIHTRNLPTPGSSAAKWTMPSDEQQRRLREREAWARKAHERSEERIRTAREIARAKTAIKPVTVHEPEAPAVVPKPEPLAVKVETAVAPVPEAPVEQAVEVADDTQRKQAAEYTAMVEAMLQELYRLSPEWEERKRRLEMRRASSHRNVRTPTPAS